MAGAKRLAGLTWGAEDLPASVGGFDEPEEDDGRYTPPYELARSLCLFGAAAAGGGADRDRSIPAFPRTLRALPLCERGRGGTGSPA
jgi:citrate lyase beta subunit